MGDDPQKMSPEKMSEEVAKLKADVKAQKVEADRVEARDGMPMPDTFDEVVAAIPIAISGLITVVEHGGRYAVDSVSVDLDYREGTVSYYVGTCECSSATRDTA